jgi:hypothetical protein
MTVKVVRVEVDLDPDSNSRLEYYRLDIIINVSVTSYKFYKEIKTLLTKFIFKVKLKYLRSKMALACVFYEDN